MSSSKSLPETIEEIQAELAKFLADEQFIGAGASQDSSFVSKLEHLKEISQALQKQHQGITVIEQRNSESGLNQLLHALNTTAIVAYTDASGTITEVNDQFCEISGYSRAELIGKNHRIVNSGCHSKFFFEEMWRKISAGIPWTGVLENRRKNGEHYWVQTLIAPLLEVDLRHRRYVAIRFDVTEQKKTEIASQRIGGIKHMSRWAGRQTPVARLPRLQSPAFASKTSCPVGGLG